MVERYPSDRSLQCLAHSGLATHNVRAQFDEEDGDAAKGEGNTDGDVDQIRGQLRDVLGQGVGNGFLEIVKDQAPCKRQRHQK